MRCRAKLRLVESMLWSNEVDRFRGMENTEVTTTALLVSAVFNFEPHGFFALLPRKLESRELYYIINACAALEIKWEVDCDVMAVFT